MRRRKRSEILGLVACLAALAVGSPPALAGRPSDGGTVGYGGVDHTRKVKTYAGPATCMACHSTSKMGSNLAEDVVNSAHFQFRTVSAFIDMPGGGSHGMLDRACGLPGTSLMANNYAGTAVAPDGTTRDEGCGKCHVAYRPPYKYASAAEALPDIDCLRCHAAVYGEEWDDPANIALYGANSQPHARKVITLADGSKSWSQDRSLKTAQSVGNLPQAHSCLRCHEHGYTGYKRATPFLPETDVHAAANVECYQCHVMERHKIARGSFVTDGVANDLPNAEVSCSSAACHTLQPHVGVNAEALNRHTVNVTCEVCHVSEMNAERNIAWRAWAPFTLDPRTLPSGFPDWQATPATTNGEYPGFFDAYSTYHAPGTYPTIRWFDGRASMLAQPYAGYADRESKGGCGKLYAFKPFVSGMLFDAGWLAQTVENGTVKHSMKWFYEQNWAKFHQFGFVDPQYPTAAGYWAARPDMAQMLNDFPMMLQFDRSIFLSEGGVVIGNPIPGPQTAATYPGVAKAINVGMGTMGLDMGYPLPPDPATAGSYLWSGTFFGMWVPVNMDQSSPFVGELGSVITMSHAIRGAAQLGEPCYTCHLTPQEYGGVPAPGQKRLDFGLLGYPDVDGNGRVDPKYGDIEAPVVVPAVGSVAMVITSKKNAQTLSVTVTVVNASTRATLPGVVVAGSLAGPPADTGLPKPYTGTTGTAGTVTFTYSKTALAAGTYTFTVTALTRDGVTYPVHCTQSITK